MNKQGLVVLYKQARSVVSKHSPEILTGIGIAGMITTTVLAVRATPKALRLIEEKNKEREYHNEDDPMTKIEIVKTCWKVYTPATIMGVISIACIIGASSVSARRTAALTTAYKLSESALSEYKDKVIETIGEKKEHNMREKMAQDRIDKDPVSKHEVIVTEKGNTLCYDYISKRYFKSDIDRIRKAENAINKRMLHDICGYASLNEFYDEIELERVEYGDELGWNTENLIDLDIGPGMAEDDTPCIVVAHHNAPKYKYC